MGVQALSLPPNDKATINIKNMGKVVVAPRMKKISVKIDRNGNVISETVKQVSSAGLETQPVKDTKVVIIEKKR